MKNKQLRTEWNYKCFFYYYYLIYNICDIKIIYFVLLK